MGLKKILSIENNFPRVSNLTRFSPANVFFWFKKWPMLFFFISSYHFAIFHQTESGTQGISVYTEDVTEMSRNDSHFNIYT